MRGPTFALKSNSVIAKLRCPCEQSAILTLIQNRKQAFSSLKLVSKRDPTFDFKSSSGIDELRCPC